MNSTDVRRKYEDGNSEEAKVISQAFWVREMSIIKLKIISQENLLSIGQIKSCLSDTRYSDKVQREAEQRVIAKYFQIKADLQFQRQLTLTVLESLLANFKKYRNSFDSRIIVEYEEKKLFGEMQFLRRDMEQLKSDISHVLQESKHNLSQTLTYLARFSRARLEQHVSLVEESLIRQIKGKEEPPIKESPKLATPTLQTTSSVYTNDPQQFKIITKRLVNLTVYKPDQSKPGSSETKFDPIEINQSKQQPPYFKKTNSIFAYYQNMFKKHQTHQNSVSPDTNQFKPIVFSLVPNLEESSRTIMQSQDEKRQSSRRKFSTQQAPMQDQKRIASKYSQSINQQNSVPMSSCADEYFEKYFRDNKEKQPQNSEQVSTIQTIEPNCDSIYKSSKQELMILPESEQKVTLMRLYKEQLRLNQGISNNIEAFRRNYLQFLQKKNSPLKYSSQDTYKNHDKKQQTQAAKPSTKQIWNAMYDNLRDKSAVTYKQQISVLDFKIITKMHQLAFSLKEVKPISPEKPKPLKVAPANQLRIKTFYQQTPNRPLTSVAKSRTEFSDIMAHDSFFQASQEGHSVNLRARVKQLGFSHYDYFRM